VARLGYEISDAWLYGTTGYAFVLNIHEDVCASGPTAWDKTPLFDLARNCGLGTESTIGFDSQDDYEELQRLAWDRVRRAIDAGVPCYGWELDGPEYYVVYGYDDVGYFFRGPDCEEGSGPKPWYELGEDGGRIEMHVVSPCRAADPSHSVKRACAFALEQAGDPDRWAYPLYRTGPGGYDVWIEALARGHADGHGVAYNAALWGECRALAFQFLREAAGRLPDRYEPLFDRAARYYGYVARNLGEVAGVFPLLATTEDQREANVRDRDRCRIAIEHLKAARSAEESALEVIGQLADRLLS
jgi:hypothetical protein